VRNLAPGRHSVTYLYVQCLTKVGVPLLCLPPNHRGNIRILNKGSARRRPTRPPAAQGGSVHCHHNRPMRMQVVQEFLSLLDSTHHMSTHMQVAQGFLSLLFPKGGSAHYHHNRSVRMQVVQEFLSLSDSTHHMSTHMQVAQGRLPSLPEAPTTRVPLGESQIQHQQRT